MKLDEFVIRRVPRELNNFIDQVTLILNYGKYSSQVVTSAPTWVARNGEFVFLQSSTQNRVYFYASNQWNWLGGGVNGAFAAGFEGDVQVNSSGTFGAVANSGFNYNIVSSLLVVRRSISINTNTGNWNDDANNPSLFVVGNNGSSGATHFIVRNSQNTRNIFEVQNNRVIVGYFRGAGVSDTQADLYVDGNPSNITISGEQSNSGPANLWFADRANSLTHTYRNVGRFYLSTGLPDQAASTIDGTGGYIVFAAIDMINLTRECPQFQLQNCNRTIKAPIVNQRFFYISSNAVTANSVIQNVSNCATVYIEGDTVFGAGSSKVINNYALWVDQGAVRFDGPVYFNNGSSNLQIPTVQFTAKTNQIITNTTAETTTFASGIGSLTIPASTFNQGKLLRISGKGVYSTPVTPGNVTLKVKLGGSTLTSIQTTAFLNSASNSGFEFNQLILCETTGSSGKFSTVGNVNYQGQLGLNTVRTFDDMDQDGVPTTIDTTTALTLDITAAWDTADAAKVINVIASSVEVLN